MEKRCTELTGFLEIVRRLRGPDGCPWDRRQTAQTIKPYVIEEAYELIEAIDEDDGDHICEELGDLLFQVALLTAIFAEASRFDMADVIAGISAKMVRRHPHVFGNADVTTDRALKEQWRTIKAEESGEKGGLGAIPRSLPALRRAQKIAERSAIAGFEWPNRDMIWDKLDEEISELRQAARAGNAEGMFEEMGDILFTLAGLARTLKINSEEALRHATTKFTSRFAAVEELATAGGQSLRDLSQEKLLLLWQTAKEKQG